MATVLPTYQKYANGVPLPTRRQSSLRIREKYIICLVFVTFLMVCFGGFFFLPDYGGRVEPLDIFLPQRGENNGHMNRHHPDEVEDIHSVRDKDSFVDKVYPKGKEINEENRNHRQEIEQEKKELLDKEMVIEDQVILF